MEFTTVNIRGTVIIVSHQLSRDSLLTLYFSLVYFSIIQSIIIWEGSSENTPNLSKFNFVIKLWRGNELVNCLVSYFWF